MRDLYSRSLERRHGKAQTDILGKYLNYISSIQLQQSHVAAFPALYLVAVTAFYVGLKLEAFAISILASAFILLLAVFHSSITFFGAERLKFAIAQRNTIFMELSSFDQQVYFKREIMTDLLAQNEAKHFSKPVLAARLSASFDSSLDNLNRLLLFSVEQYLSEVGRSKGGNISLVLLKADKDGFFSVVGSTASTGGARQMSFTTTSRYDDPNTFVGKLWAADNSKVMCFSNTEVAESRGDFTFSTPHERTVVRSAFAYRIDNPVIRHTQRDQRYGIWYLDADAEGVFPDFEERKLLGGLIAILSRYEDRLLLDLAYRAVISALDSASEGAPFEIKNFTRGNSSDDG